MFKAGDVVQYKSGTTFSNHQPTATVDRVSTWDDGSVAVWLKETGRWMPPEKIELVTPPDPTLTRMQAKLSELEIEVRELQKHLDKKKDAVDAVKEVIKIWEEL